MASSAAYYSRYNKATRRRLARLLQLIGFFCSSCRRKPPLDSGQIYCPMFAKANACGVLLALFIERIFLLSDSVIQLACH